MSEFAVALFLAVTVKTILDYVAQPLRRKYPDLDLWWFDYVALLCGGAVAWLVGIDLFDAFVPVPWLSRLLTALVVGGGAKLLNDVFGDAPTLKIFRADAKALADDDTFTLRPRGW